MPLSFPASPTVGQQSTQNGRTYSWTGYAWELVAAAGGGGGDDARWDYFKPAAPTSVTASGGNGQAAVSWTAPSVLGQTPITDYVVQFQPSGGSWTPFSDGTSTSASATVTGLTNGTAYTFRVAAVNGIGQGAWSSASNSVTPAVGNVIQTTSGLYAWYDASAASVYSADTGGSLVTADGGSVRRLEDSSGNGRHLQTFGIGGPSSLVTAGQNGRNYLQIGPGGSPTNLRTAANRESGSFLVTNPMTVFAVWRSNSQFDTLFRNLEYSWGGNDWDTALHLKLNFGKPAFDMPTQNEWVGQSTRNQEWFLMRATLNGTSSSLHVNGTYEAPTSGNAAAAFTHPCGDIWMQGVYQLGELVFYTGALSSGTASAIDSFLMNKWGIT